MMTQNTQETKLQPNTKIQKNQKLRRQINHEIQRHIDEHR